MSESVFIVIHDEFDGVGYNRKIVKVFNHKEKAKSFVRDSALDLEIETHYVD